LAEITEIEWCDHTFNPWIGCMKVSPLCDNCYAATMADTRFGWARWGGPGTGVGTRVRTSKTNWKKPHAWNRKAAASGARPFVFCASLADVFDNAVEPQWRADLFDLIRQTPHLVWLLLTKRPQNIFKMVKACGGLPSNVALGTSAGIQTEVMTNGAWLVELKQRLDPLFVFLSAEPLLEPIDLTVIPDFEENDWVIVGGESGHGARPMDLEWARDVRAQCEASGSTVFNFKQVGAQIGHGANTLDGQHHLGRPTLRARSAENRLSGVPAPTCQWE